MAPSMFNLFFLSCLRVLVIGNYLEEETSFASFLFSREEERLEFVNVENKFENSEADDDGDTWQMVIHL